MKTLVAIDMIGTWNALKTPFKGLGWEFQYVASGAAVGAMSKDGIPLLPAEANPEEVIGASRPELLITGISHLSPTLERKFALAALENGIKVVMYRDYSGVAPWVSDVTSHPRASKLLHFLMFDNATAEAIRRQKLPCRRVEVVGSSYYDNMVGYDALAARNKTRKAVGVDDDALFIIAQNAADYVRVNEVMEPVVSGLLQQKNPRVVFAPLFHPKDKDAPFYEKEKGVWEVRPSGPYDPVVARLEGRVKVIKEPTVRNRVADPYARIAVADFIVMNPLSTDTWTAAYFRVPIIIPLLPLQREETKKISVDPERGFELINEGAADVAWTKEELTRYIAALPGEYESIKKRLQGKQTKFNPAKAADTIKEALSRIVAE